MIASLLVGPLMDNEGKKAGLVLGLALAAIALLALPKSRSFGMIATLLFVLGLGGGIIVTGANALASSVNEAHRGTTLNLVNLFFGLGGLATPFLSANLLCEEFGSAVLPHGRSNSRDLGNSHRDADAGANRGAKLRIFGGWFRARETCTVPSGIFSVPVCGLRSGGLELARAASDRQRSSGIARPQHSLTGLRVGIAGGAFCCVARCSSACLN